MLTAYIHGNERLGIYQDSENQAQKQYNIDNNIIDNKIILIAGTSGSGKSITTERLMWDYYRKKYTVIVITEKMDYEFESAFAMFPVESKYHLEILEAMGINPYPKEKTKRLVKLYHPFTFNLPDVKLPPINFFTFSLKRLTDPSLISILYGGIDAGADAITVRDSLNTIKNLKDTEDIWDFILESKKRIDSNKEKDSLNLDYNPTETLIPISMAGDKKTVNKIHDGILPFREDYMLMPEKSKYNINMIKILNDNSHYHIFSTKWIKSPRLKFFVYITILEQIKQAIASDMVEKQILLVYEEIKSLLPVNSDISYEKQLASVLMKINLAIRMKGTVIGTTQSYYGTNKQFRDSCNEQFLFRLSQEDREKFIHRSNLKQIQVDVLGTLRTGHFTSLGNLLQFKTSKYTSNVAPYAHSEQNERFIDKFSKVYPELLTDYTALKLEMLNHRSKAEEKVAKYVSDLKEKDRKEKAEKKAKLDKIPNQNKEIIDKMKADDLDELKKYCYDKRKENLSFRQIGRNAKIPLTGPTVKKYALEVALKESDNAYLQNPKNT